MGSPPEETRLLREDGQLQHGIDERYTGDGSVDIKGKPVLKSNTGRWKACPFILGTECCERLAYYGIAINLVTYLTGKLHEGNVAAATNVNIWQGTCYITSLIGAVLADAYWGRYWTIAAFSSIYFTGMCILTLSATVPSLRPAECVDSVCPSATTTQNMVFFVGLYLIALGTGGIKPCVSPFGADQFDDTDPIESTEKGSFFNWYYLSINIGSLVSSSLLVWIQDDIGWGLGFAIPAVFMGIAIASFFSGTTLYRFQKPGGSPITRMCRVLIAALRKVNVEVPADENLLYEVQQSSPLEGSRKLQHSAGFKCLDKAAVITESDTKSADFLNPWRICTVTQVEELKILIRMFPIWATGIIFSAVYSQMSTMFIEQGEMMETKLGSFTIPAASLSMFDIISVIIWVPLYDRAIVPIAKKFTGNECGFSVLMRMGIGLLISIVAISVAALVEIKRLQLARELKLVDEDVAVPLSILWQIPQYFLIGAAEVFTYIGQLQFFYDESPDAMRSLCSALALVSSSLGSYLSSLILTIVTDVTTEDGSVGWIPDNLNEGHLDYFFWLLAALSFFNLICYVFVARKYKQKTISS